MPDDNLPRLCARSDLADVNYHSAAGCYDVPVIDDQPVRINVDIGKSFGEIHRRNLTPMCSRPAVVQQPGLGQQKGATAYGTERSPLGMLFPESSGQCRAGWTFDVGIQTAFRRFAVMQDTPVRKA